MQNSVAGISPGTRTMGLAIIDQGELIDFRMYRFQGRWSEEKQRIIINRLSRYLKQHKVQVVVVKRVHPLRRSRELQVLIDALDILLQGHAMPLHYFDIDELKEYILSAEPKNKILLGERVALLYPEVSYAVRQEKSNLNPYHEKVFEAVALAHMVVHMHR